MSFSPYVNFGGNCLEAFNRYKEIFGGELMTMTWADMPEGDAELPPGAENLVMHAALNIGDHVLMGSDDPGGISERNDGFNVAFTTKNTEESRRIFDALTDGGEVVMPFAETFFSPGFGVCRDRFGVPWMIDTLPPMS